VFGINHKWSYRLMPLLGSFDSFLGGVILVRPIRAILIWLLF
jgi:hypothetical protein